MGLGIVYIIFFFLLVIILSSGLLILVSNNSVQSVLYLVLVFCSSSCFLMLLRIEFLAMLLLLVYVGAVAVLFLFVVMMLNVSIVELRESFLSYLPIGSVVLLLLFSELFLTIYVDLRLYTVLWQDSIFETWIFFFDFVSNTVLIGQFIYTYYSHLLLLASFILLLALIGAIFLTLEYFTICELSNKQEIFDQVASSNDSLFFWGSDSN